MAILIAIVFMPLWVSLILAFLGMAYFDYFIEAVVLLLLSDLLYGVAGGKFFGVAFVSFIIAVVLLMATESMKRKLKFYNKNK